MTRVLTESDIKKYSIILKGCIDNYLKTKSANPEIVLALATAINTLAELDRLLWLIKREEE